MNWLLAVSTNPADMPDRLNERGSLVEQWASASFLNLQLHIRDREAKFGPNPHVDSVLIQHFSYRMAEGPWVELVKDYPDNFWMQGNPRHDPDPAEPIPYIENGKITIAIDFVLNGESYEFTGDMPALESTQVLPTWLVEQGI